MHDSVTRLSDRAPMVEVIVGGVPHAVPARVAALIEALAGDVTLHRLMAVARTGQVALHYSPTRTVVELKHQTSHHLVEVEARVG